MQGPFSYVRSHWPQFALGGVCLLLTNALGLMVPRLLRDGVDTVREGGSGEQVLPIALWIVGVAALQAAVRIGSRITMFFAARRIEFELRNDVYARLCRLAPSFYRHHATGDVISRATNDLTNVRVLLGPGILNVINTGIVYLAVPVFLLMISPWLTLLALVPYPLMLWVARSAVRGIYDKTRESQEALALVSNRVQENLTGMAVVKAYAREETEIDQFRTLSEAYRSRSLELAHHRARIMPIMGAMGGLAVLIVLMGGGFAVHRQEITLGEFVAFTGYLAYLIWPTLALGWILSLWQRGMASWVRLQTILGAEPTLVDPPSPIPVDDIRGAIEIRDLRVEREGKTILEIEALRIPAGGVLAVVGSTGSGKSTLAEALARVTEIEPGTVLVDGVDLTQIGLWNYRRQVGFVPQETFLFSMTLAQNIAFGRPEATEEEIRHAAEVAMLAGDIATFPQGYETIVGERGITLSGGQRQRAAIARALLVAPRLLILDDCLSAVDLKTERDILAGLKRELPGRTAVIISHRLAAARLASQIVVLEEGRVVEQGTHSELLALEGVYASLWRRQMMMEEIEDLPEAAE